MRKQKEQPKPIEEYEPLISVVTPVYNGEKYLSECIESVLAQTYNNWEYVIVNNCSTDRTLSIAKVYAAKDSRIRIHTNNALLALMPNWNHALRQINPNSKYCKVVHADDWLFPDCVKQMVEVAEHNPSVGIVGAYRIDGDHIDLEDLPFPKQVFPGHEPCRHRLLGGHDVFGSPTSLLLRADLVRSREKFYNEQNFHADTEVCFDLLQSVDFGFVHQVLTYTRRHDETQTSATRKFDTRKVSHFLHMVKYGPAYLDDEEFRKWFKIARERYYKSLANHMLRLDKRKFIPAVKDLWVYHEKSLADLKKPISVVRLLGSIIVLLYNKGLDFLKINGRL